MRRERPMADRAGLAMDSEAYPARESIASWSACAETVPCAETTAAEPAFTDSRSRKVVTQRTEQAANGEIGAAMVREQRRIGAAAQIIGIEARQQVRCGRTIEEAH